jgi:hypothetical protein
LTRCPGCGAGLPESDWPIGRRTNASAACWQLHAQVLGFEAEHLAGLGRFHQLTVDAYGAQHGGGRSPAISLPFSLIGLHLALEEGWHGDEVRAAHQALAQQRARWPSFTPPVDPHWLTVAAVAGASTPDAHGASNTTTFALGPMPSCRRRSAPVSARGERPAAEGYARRKALPAVVAGGKVLMSIYIDTRR